MFQKVKEKIGLSVFCAGLVLIASGCASKPSAYFRYQTYRKTDQVKVAIIPFANLSSERDADKKVVYSLITHLLNSNYFDVIEVGEIQKALKDAKVRAGEDLSLENIQEIGKLTEADVLLMGAVEEYKIDSATVLGERVFVPEASLSVRLVTTSDGSIIWSANHHRRGDDHVTIFGMGRIDSISQLVDVIIQDTIDSLVKAMRKRRGAVRMLKNGNLDKEVSSEAQMVETQTDEKLKQDVATFRAQEEQSKKEVSSSREKLDVRKDKKAGASSSGKPVPVKKAEKQELRQKDAVKETVVSQPEPEDERQKLKQQYEDQFKKIKSEEY